MTVLFLFLMNMTTGLLFINEGLFHCDSVFLARAVENTYKTGILQPAVHGRYGAVIINSIVYLPFFLLRQNTDFAVRFSSVLFHSLSIVMLFLFVKELFGNDMQAFFAALLFSFTPLYFMPNTYGKEHGLAMFFLILSFYLLYRGLNKKSLALIALASFIFAFSFSIREALIVTVFLFILLYFSPPHSLERAGYTFPKERLKPKFLLAFFAPFLLISSFLFFTYLKQIIYMALYIKNTDTVHFIGFFSSILSLASRDLIKSCSVLFFVFFLFGFFKMLYNRKVFFATFFLLWFLLIFYFGNTTAYVARYLDLVVLPMAVFVSYLLVGLYTKNKIIVLVLVAYFVVGMFYSMFPMLVFRHFYNGQKHFALFLKEKTEDNAVIIAIDDTPIIEYYGKRKTETRPVNDKEKIDNFIGKIKEYLAQGTPVYMAETALSYDKERMFRNAFFNNFKVQVIGEKVSEDFHRAELEFHTYKQRLLRIQPKE